VKLRLFFALWPPPEVRDALFAAAGPLRDACRGRPVPKRNLHLTLAFLGGVPSERLDSLVAAAAGLATAPFELVFDRAGRFDSARVAFLACSRAPPAARALAEALRAAMAPLGFPPERRPFVPHLTVLRKSRDCEPGELAASVSWPVGEFVLVHSALLPSGPEYQPVARFPFDGKPVIGVRPRPGPENPA
jgi:2'-5' RNA ligase